MVFNIESTCDKLEHEAFIKLKYPQGHLLENFIDNIRKHSIDKRSNKVKLDFQMVCLFDDKEVKDLVIQPINTDKIIILNGIKLQSPYVGNKYPHILWSKNCRFHIKTELDCSEFKPKKFILHAKLEDELRPVGEIFFRPFLFKRLLDNLPRLHFWNGEWNFGGFDHDSLKTIYEKILIYLPEDFVVVETGAGLTTLCCLSFFPKKVFSIDINSDLERRIKKWLEENGFPSDRLEFINERSETALPKLVQTGEKADLCIIDGAHGFPTVFVDFCYMNMLLKKDGFLIIDDLHLPSVNLLAVWLYNMPNWKFISRFNYKKSCIFLKKTNDIFMPDFGGQPWIMRNFLPM